MTIKSKHVSVPVARAIHAPILPSSPSPPPKAARKIRSFFRLHSSVLRRRRPETFRDLRAVWGLDETAYKDSFRANPDYREVPDEEDDGDNVSTDSFVVRNRGRGYDDDDDPRGMARLRSVGSGSCADGEEVTFVTPDGRFVVVAVRGQAQHPEHVREEGGWFFGGRAMGHYSGRMRSEPQNLLLRVCDVLVPGHKSLGLAVGTAADRFLVLENPVVGKSVETMGPLWERYELAPSPLPTQSPVACSRRRGDVFEGRVQLDDALHEQLIALVRADTHALAQAGACGYKLVLVRFPAGVDGPDVVGHNNAGPFRSGVVDKTGEWRYRVFVSDFWRLGGPYQCVGEEEEDTLAVSGQVGPWEYRRSFLQLVEGIFEGGIPPRYAPMAPPPEYVE